MVLALATAAALQRQASASAAARSEVQAALGALVGDLLAVEAGLGSLAGGRPLLAGGGIEFAGACSGGADGSGREAAGAREGGVGGTLGCAEAQTVGSQARKRRSGEEGDECDRRSSCSSISLSHGVVLEVCEDQKCCFALMRKF